MSNRLKAPTAESLRRSMYHVRSQHISRHFTGVIEA